MTAFRKKPVVVQAHRWTGTNTRDVKAWMNELVGDQPIALFVPRRSSTMTKTLFANVLEDAKPAVTAALWVAANDAYLGINNGEWIINDALGFYPCADDGTGLAPLNYEPVIDGATIAALLAGKFLTPLQRGWTSHGHSIEGMPQHPPEPTTRARCGGPAICTACSREAAQARAGRP